MNHSSKLSREDLQKMSDEALYSLILELQKNLQDMNAKNDNLLEQVLAMNSRTYGRKTEKATALYEQQEMDLSFEPLNEAEAEQDPDAREPELNEVIPRRKKAKGKRTEELGKVKEHETRNLYLTEEELQRIFKGGKYKRLPDEQVTKLEHIPAKFIAVTYHIGVYASAETGQIVRADRPLDILPKSILTPSLMAAILTAKYINAVPLYRQEQAYRANGVRLTRATMANWVIKVSERWLEPYYNRLKEELLKNEVIHADETPFEVIRDGRPAGSKSYMWVYRTGIHSDGQEIILYDYCPTRGHENVERFLGSYRGTLQTDGYSAYHQLNREHPDQFTVAGCWVHLKRKFTDGVRIQGKTCRETFSAEGAQKISRIFHENNKLEGLPPDEKLKQRQELIRPLVDEFFAWVKAEQPHVDSGSLIGKAFAYAVNQEKYLRVFLTDAHIDMSNNPAELAIRPFTVGRKNWVLIDTKNGAKASAVIYSLAETSRAHDLRPYEYFRYLLEELPKYVKDMKAEIPESLLPWSEELPESLRSKK